MKSGGILEMNMFKVERFDHLPWLFYPAFPCLIIPVALSRFHLISLCHAAR